VLGDAKGAVRDPGRLVQVGPWPVASAGTNRALGTVRNAARTRRSRIPSARNTRTRSSGDPAPGGGGGTATAVAG